MDGGAASLRSALNVAPLPRNRTLIVRSFVSDIIHTYSKLGKVVVLPQHQVTTEFHSMLSDKLLH